MHNHVNRVMKEKQRSPLEKNWDLSPTPLGSFCIYLEIQFNPLEETWICRPGTAGKGRYEFFSSVKLIDVFWLLTNTCENNTYFLGDGR